MAGGIALSVIGGAVFWRGKLREEARQEAEARSGVPIFSTRLDIVKSVGAVTVPLGLILFVVGVGVGLSEERIA